MKVNLRSLRLKRHIPMKKLAKDSGVAKSTISKIESGTITPSIRVLCKLCNALGVDIDDMLDCERGHCDDNE
jgi:transcriptional regulator with XRE-family HTH domain